MPRRPVAFRSQFASQCIVRGVPCVQVGDGHLDESVALRAVIQHDDFLANAIVAHFGDDIDPSDVVEAASNQTRES